MHRNQNLACIAIRIVDNTTGHHRWDDRVVEAGSVEADWPLPSQASHAMCSDRGRNESMVVKSCGGVGRITQIKLVQDWIVDRLAARRAIIILGQSRRHVI